MRYDVLLFDVDDTLLDFGACEQEALHATFARFALPFSPREKQAFHVINDVLWARYEQGEISRDELCRTRFARLFAQMGAAVAGDAGAGRRRLLDACQYRNCNCRTCYIFHWACCGLCCPPA